MPVQPDGIKIETIPTLNQSSSDAVIAATVISSKRPALLRRWLIRLVWFDLTVILVLCAGEVVVRLVAPQVLFPCYVTGSPLGIRVPIPHARYTHTSPEVSVEFRLNAMGIRSDREYTMLKPPGVIRIVGLGDSFTQGYEVNVEETYLFQLEKILTAQGYNVEVINLGVSGYGNAEQLIQLKEFGLRFDPDAVIVGYFANDIDDNMRCNLYQLDDNDKLIRSASEYLPDMGLRNKLYSSGAYRMFAQHSHLFNLLWEQAASTAKRILRQAQKEQHPSVSLDYGMKLTGRLMDEIKHVCVSHGVAFLVLDIPSPNLDETTVLSEFVEFVEQEDVIRTAPRLRAAGKDAYLYRKTGQHHWTPTAHRIAAELLAERLTESQIQ